MDTVTQARTSPRRRRREERLLTPLEQIRRAPSRVTGAFAYYLRPEGAILREALVLYPNGGVPDIDDRRLAARYGRNAEYYRQRQADKGFEYLGQVLTEEAMRKVMAVLKANNAAAIEEAREEIADAEAAIASTERPDIRDIQRQRKAAWERRLHYLTEDFNPTALAKELDDIARAHQLAKVDPNIMRVIRSMFSEFSQNMSATMREAVAQFAQDGDVVSEDTVSGDVPEDQPKRRNSRLSLPSDVNLPAEFIDNDD